MRKILVSSSILFGVELLTIPIYLFFFVGLVFNDSGYTAETLGEFVRSMVSFIGFYVTVTVITYFILFKLKFYLKLLHFVFVPYRLLMTIFIIFCYMSVYATDDVNEKLNPLYILHQHQVEEQRAEELVELEEQYKEYAENKNDYESIYKADLVKLVADVKEKNFYLVYEGERNLMKRLEVVEEKVFQNTKPIEVFNEKDESLLFYESPSGDFVKFPSKNIVLNLTRAYVMLPGETNERISFRTLLMDYVYNNINMYTLSYENGVISRTGKVGARANWEFYKDGERVLSRSAKNETELEVADLDYIFDESGTYEVYLSTYIERPYQERRYWKVSNRVEWQQ